MVSDRRYTDLLKPSDYTDEAKLDQKVPHSKYMLNLSMSPSRPLVIKIKNPFPENLENLHL